jgi:hypothetical protein
LRNSFAADLFENGTEPELVGQWLGFAQAVSANRLHRAWKTWCEEEKREEKSELDEGASSSEDSAASGTTRDRPL